MTHSEMHEIIKWANEMADHYDDLFFSYNFDLARNILKLRFGSLIYASKNYVITIIKDEYDIKDFYYRRRTWERKILEACRIPDKRSFLDVHIGTKWMEELSQGCIAFKNGEYIKVMLNEMYGLGKLKIEKVIFNKPATIVFWSDGTKTVVKAQKKDKYDKEKGLAMAIAKKALGNTSKYYDVFKVYLEEDSNGSNRKNRN